LDPDTKAVEENSERESEKLKAILVLGVKKKKTPAALKTVVHGHITNVPSFSVICF